MLLLFFSKKKILLLKKRKHFKSPENMEKESATDWVQARNKSDILNKWTWNECIYFLLLSPTTQKKLGGCGLDTEGALRLLVVERLSILFVSHGINPGTMPYCAPRKLGKVYGQYETINRIQLAHFCTLLDSQNFGSIQPTTTNTMATRTTTTAADSINCAVERNMNLFAKRDPTL